MRWRIGFLILASYYRRNEKRKPNIGVRSGCATLKREWKASSMSPCAVQFRQGSILNSYTNVLSDENC